jgi:hypothetical protein
VDRSGRTAHGVPTELAESTGPRRDRRPREPDHQLCQRALAINLTASGSLPSDVAITAKTTGLASGASATTGDKVYASFKVIDEPGEPPKTVAVQLTSANGIDWSGSIRVTAGYTFANGTQYITFSALRAADGKANSLVSLKEMLQEQKAAPPFRPSSSRGSPSRPTEAAGSRSRPAVGSSRPR